MSKRMPKVWTFSEEVFVRNPCIAVELFDLNKDRRMYWQLLFDVLSYFWWNAHVVNQSIFVVKFQRWMQCETIVLSGAVTRNRLNSAKYYSDMLFCAGRCLVSWKKSKHFAKIPHFFQKTPTIFKNFNPHLKKMIPTEPLKIPTVGINPHFWQHWLRGTRPTAPDSRGFCLREKRSLS